MHYYRFSMFPLNNQYAQQEALKGWQSGEEEEFQAFSHTNNMLKFLQSKISHPDLSGCSKRQLKCTQPCSRYSTRIQSCFERYKQPSKTLGGKGFGDSRQIKRIDICPQETNPGCEHLFRSAQSARSRVMMVGRQAKALECSSPNFQNSTRVTNLTHNEQPRYGNRTHAKKVMALKNRSESMSRQLPTTKKSSINNQLPINRQLAINKQQLIFSSFETLRRKNNSRNRHKFGNAQKMDTLGAKKQTEHPGLILESGHEKTMLAQVLNGPSSAKQHKVQEDSRKLGEGVIRFHSENVCTMQYGLTFHKNKKSVVFRKVKQHDFFNDSHISRQLSTR